MLAEGVEFARPGLGSSRQGRRLLSLARFRELVEQLGKVGVGVPGPRQVGERGQQRSERLWVVASEIARPVVDRDDALGLLVIDVDKGDREPLEAELAGGQEDVVPREYLARSPVRDDRPVLAEAAHALLDGLEVPAARIAGIHPKLIRLDEFGLNDWHRRRLSGGIRFRTDPSRGAREKAITAEYPAAADLERALRAAGVSFLARWA